MYNNSMDILDKNAHDSIFASVSAGLPAAGGKVKGIVEVMKHFGLTRSQIMAFGDSRNDMDMIQYAQIGVAMGNAPDSVRAVADYVTETVDEDGICAAMRRFGILD